MKRSYLSAGAVNSGMACERVVVQGEVCRGPARLACRGWTHVGHVAVVIEVVAVGGRAVAVEPERLLEAALDVGVVAVGSLWLHLDGGRAAAPGLLEHADDVARGRLHEHVPRRAR